MLKFFFDRFYICVCKLTLAHHTRTHQRDLNINSEPENETQSAQCTVTCLYHKPRMQFPGNSGSHHAFSLEIHCCYAY
jgi:hypothetical protein